MCVQNVNQINAYRAFKISKSATSVIECITAMKNLSVGLAITEVFAWSVIDMEVARNAYLDIDHQG